MAAPRLRDQHAHHLLDRPAGENQQLQHVVEGGRIAAAAPHHRRDLGHVWPADRVGQHALAGMHPVDVAPHRVDLAIVGDKPEWMGQIPGGESVCAVALVDQRQGTGHPGIGEVGVVFVDLIGQQQPLVDDRAGRQRADVGERLFGEPQLAQLNLKPLPQHKQLPFKEVARRLPAPADEGLTHCRLHVAGGAADGAVVDRHAAPAQKLLPLLAAEPLEEALGALPLLHR